MTGVIGYVLIALGVALMMVSPMHFTFVQRPRLKSEIVAPILREAFPFTPTPPAIEELLQQLDTIETDDPLLRAVRATSSTYDQA